MKIVHLYSINKGAFSDAMQLWADANRIPLDEHAMNEALLELVDGALIFHINHNLSKDILELLGIVEEHNLPTHKIDVNGTLAATVSNFTMWLERNKAKSILVLGGEDVASSENLHRFLGSLVKDKEEA